MNSVNCLIYFNLYIYDVIYRRNISVHNTSMHNINAYIFYLFLFKFAYWLRFCCFTAPVAMPNNDNTLI